MATSSIFGEPQYYNDGDKATKTMPVSAKFLDSFFGGKVFASAKNSAELMTQAIDEALDHDFLATLEFTKELRMEYYMRLNPAVILVRAAKHPKREAFTKDHPGKFTEVVNAVAKRPDDLITMVEYFISVYKTKKNFPNVLKRAIAAKIGQYDRYQLNKHATKGIGLVDVVRIVHPTNPNALISELMENGSVKADQDRETWREQRSKGVSWNDIFAAKDLSHITHQDILFQLSNILKDGSPATLKLALERMKTTAAKSMVFPYRYMVALKQLKVSHSPLHPNVVDAIEGSLKTVLAAQPQLHGRVMVLSDNSGSAWGAFTVDGASTRVAEIDNLSAILTAKSSDEGYAGIFGDKLKVEGIDKSSSVFPLWDKLNSIGQGIGHATENGVWLFWDEAIRNKVHWDTVFIYSDMQAGHGGLYGTDRNQYKNYVTRGNYIDVMKLVEDYRKKVNPRVNVFCVQTAGYGNTALPEMMPRVANLSGWTGKEALFAAKYIAEWDRVQV
jgi:hypothetical protein